MREWNRGKTGEPVHPPDMSSSSMVPGVSVHVGPCLASPSAVGTLNSSTFLLSLGCVSTSPIPRLRLPASSPDAPPPLPVGGVRTDTRFMGGLTPCKPRTRLDPTLSRLFPDFCGKDLSCWIAAPCTCSEFCLASNAFRALLWDTSPSPATSCPRRDLRELSIGVGNCGGAC